MLVIFSELLDLGDHHHATTLFTQPALSGFTIQVGFLDTQVSAFCSLVPRPHPPRYILLFVHHFLSTLVFEKIKKCLVAWSFLSDLWDQKQENNFVWP